MKRLIFPLLFITLYALSACQKTNTAAPLQTTAIVQTPAPWVDAGPAQIVYVPIDTAVLKGSARDSSAPVVGYIWSQIAGPSTATIVDDGNPTTIVRGLVLGTYIFQLMAVDSIGHTGVDTLSVTVMRKGTDTLRTYFAGSTYPYELNFLSNSSSPNGSNMTSELTIEEWTINSVPVTGRSLLNFNTAPIPAGVTSVKSATLYLYSDRTPQNGNLVNANFGANNDFYIQRISSSWNTTGTTTWNSLPSIDTVAEVHVPTTTQSNLDLNVDVTALFNSMLAKGNYGFEMRLNTEVTYNSRIFCSSNYSDTTKRPVLVVNY